MSAASPWIAGINAVASALEHDAEHVKEVLIEAGGRNPRLTEIEQTARAKEIPVRRVNEQALSGVAGKVRTPGPAARYAGAPTLDDAKLAALIDVPARQDAG